jgi:hypothetical protein
MIPILLLVAFAIFIAFAISYARKYAVPDGYIGVRCRSCNAEQNIEIGSIRWECHRCHTSWHLAIQ